MRPCRKCHEEYQNPCSAELSAATFRRLGERQLSTRSRTFASPKPVPKADCQETPHLQTWTPPLRCRHDDQHAASLRELVLLGVHGVVGTVFTAGAVIIGPQSIEAQTEDVVLVTYTPPPDLRRALDCCCCPTRLEAANRCWCGGGGSLGCLVLNRRGDGA